jgi:hypothetical protein
MSERPFALSDFSDFGKTPRQHRSPRHGGTLFRVDIDYEHEQCCAEPRKMRLITNRQRQWKCGNCGTVRPRE